MNNELLALLAKMGCTVTEENGKIVIEPSKKEEVEAWEPKDGDILTSRYRPFIFNGLYSMDSPCAYLGINSGGALCIPDHDRKWTSHEYRPATDSEKQTLFDALAKEGKCWNAEKKCVEDLPYQPKDKELVWCYNYEYKACCVACFYDAKNKCRFNSNGSRNGLEYDHYAPFEGEWPEWAREALTKLED